MWQTSPLTLIPLPPLGGEETLTKSASFLLEPSPPNGGRGQGEGGRLPSQLRVVTNA